MTRDRVLNVVVYLGAGLLAALVSCVARGDVRDVTVRIVEQKCDGRSCSLSMSSGTVIGRDPRGRAIVLTVAHGLHGGRVHVDFRGKMRPGQVLAHDQRNDLAAVAFDYAGDMPCVRVARRLPRERVETTTAGYSGKGTWQQRQLELAGRSGGDLLLDGPVLQGESGGGVFSPAGELLGVIWGTDGRQSRAKHCEQVHQFFRVRLGGEPSCAAPAEPAVAPPAADLGRQDTLEPEPDPIGHTPLQEPVPAPAVVEGPPGPPGPPGRDADPSVLGGLRNRVGAVGDKVGQVLETAGEAAAGIKKVKRVADLLSTWGPLLAGGIFSGGVASPILIGLALRLLTKKRLASILTPSVPAGPGSGPAAHPSIVVHYSGSPQSLPTNPINAKPGSVDPSGAGITSNRPGGHATGPVVFEQPPAPQVVVTENHYVPVERDTFAEAFAWATQQLVQKYPSGQNYAETLQGMIRQYMKEKVSHAVR